MDKAELLGAVAAAGTRGKAAYDQAQESLRQQNQEAVRMALSNSIAQSMPTEGQNQLAARISQPYQNQGANLTAQSATVDDYFNRIGTSAGTYMDQASALVPALERRYELELANALALREWDAAHSGGGGSGGGGGGSDTNDWLSLKKEFGSEGAVKDFFLGTAQGDKYQARALAIEAGMPEGLANSYFTRYGSGDEEFADIGSQALSKYQSGNLIWTDADGREFPVRNRRQLRTRLSEIATQIPGNQHSLRKQILSQAKKKSKAKKRK